MKTHLSLIFAALTALVLLPVTPAFADPTDHPGTQSIHQGTAGKTKETCKIEGEISIREIDSKNIHFKREFYKCERDGGGKLTYRQLSFDEIDAFIASLPANKKQSKKDKPLKKGGHVDSRPRSSSFDIPF